MTAAGARANMPREQRTCRICGSQDLETAEHFVSKCPVYAVEREECIRRLWVVLAGRVGPLLCQALVLQSAQLFLGDGLFRDLPPDVAFDAEVIVCNFLKVAWKKRAPIWATLCQDGDEWAYGVRGAD